jgi:transcription initiation protein SPT3
MGDPQQYYFTEEIMSMMHAFGDCSQPMPESAKLIESIVHEQLDALIDKADEVAQLRGSPTIGAEDILFLLRKDKSKLVRLINHLYVKDIKQTFNDGNTADIRVFDAARSQTRRVKICYDYMCQLDEFGEYKKVFNQALFDEIKNQRMRRMDSLTRNMSSQEYNDFTKARQVSFISKIKAEKFSDWLLYNRPNTKLSVFAFEMIQYLAHETVAQIVDLALLVKQDAERDPHDPLSVLITKSSHNKHDKAINTGQSYQQQPIKSFSIPYDGLRPAAQPRCITPNNIHEAMRRYCDQKSPFKAYRMRDSSSPLVILCI